VPGPWRSRLPVRWAQRLYAAVSVSPLLAGVALARSRDPGGQLVGLALLAGPLSLPLATAISLPLRVTRASSS
jgi:hypothetical protein